MSTNYHTPIPSSPPQPATAATINAPLGQLDAAVHHLANNEAITARNAANTADVSLVKLNASDQLEINNPFVKNNYPKISQWVEDQAANARWWNMIAFGLHWYLRASNDADSDSSIAIDVTRSGSSISEVRFPAGNIYVVNTISAQTVTDRTPAYVGDALAEIAAISDDGNGGIDHATLPTFARVRRPVAATEPTEGLPFAELGEMAAVSAAEGEAEQPAEYTDERDLGAMISLLTVAVQQLTKRIEALESPANPTVEVVTEVAPPAG
jgi:hypothetical protein